MTPDAMITPGQARTVLTGSTLEQILLFLLLTGFTAVLQTGSPAVSDFLFLGSTVVSDLICCCVFIDRQRLKINTRQAPNADILYFPLGE